MKLIEKHNIEIGKLASKMQIKEKALKEKLEGKQEFYLDEMIKIKNIFQLNARECDELFFAETTEIEKIRQ